MPERLVTVGDLVVDVLLDLTLPVWPAKHQTARSLRFEAGGACTTILAARELGMAVAAMGAVGSDLQGEFLLKILGEAAVDASALQCQSGTSTTVVALADNQSGEHVFLGRYGTGSAIAMNKHSGELLAQADAIFMPGYSLLDERLDGLVSGVLRALRTSEARLYFDVGPFLGGLPADDLRAILNVTDTLLLTEEEIPFVAAGADGLEACRRLLDAYPRLTIVVKLAERGCHILSSQLEERCPGFPADVVDTIGAGDAFAAAYIWADLQGYSPAECGTIGNAMGAASVARQGAGSNVPRCADVQRILDEMRTGIQLTC